MKRGLVSYSSDEDEVDNERALKEASPVPPPSKKRKLPSLSDALAKPAHLDDPTKHQGRRRTQPHIDGQFAALLYVPIHVDTSPTLFKLLTSAIGKTRETVPGLVSFLPADGDGHKHLHLSLSRPIYVRSDKRDDLRRAVKLVAKSSSPFEASFASFCVLENDEKTRAFLGIEIGAGHTEFDQISKTLTPSLTLLHQQAYYDQPRFHCSFAWTLMTCPATSATTSNSNSSQVHVRSNIPSGFPQELSSQLDAAFGEQLRNITIQVSELSLKVGKDVFRWQLEVV